MKVTEDDESNHGAAISSGVRDYNCLTSDIHRICTIILTQSTSLPDDMSLKCKVRFISSQPFSWLHSAKVHQEAAGLVAFTKGQSLPEVGMYPGGRGV